MKAQRFLFGEDLGHPARERRDAAERAEAAQRAAVAAAAEAAYAAGLAAGRQEARQESQARLGQATEQLAASLAIVLGDIDRQTSVIEQEALAFFATLARKLAGQALAAQPLEGIMEAAGEAFRHLRGVPHLAVRVHDTLVEEVDTHLRALARERGFEGRIIVIGADDLAPGDAKVDWADGGVVALGRTVDDAVAAILGTMVPGLPPSFTDRQRP